MVARPASAPARAAWARATIAADDKAGLLRRPRTRSGGSHPRAVVDGREVVVLSSNDYLGLSVHPTVRAAAADAAQRHGVGATGSRHLSGGHEAIQALEDSLCRFESCETATVAPSGYAANLAALQAVGGPDAVILSDEANHASIVDGCRASRSAVEVFRHRDLEDLESRLRRSRLRPVIVSDTVFSMDGHLADVAGLAALAARFDAWLILDEAHATGVLGPGGRGAAAAAGVDPAAENVIRVITFSKALGAGGGAVCGAAAVRQLLLQRGRALIFSTALPHPTVAAAAAALEVLRTEPELLERLGRNAGILRAAAGLPPDVMPIVAVVLGDPRAAMLAEQRLWEEGFLVQAVRPPSVPAGTSRLRAVASALHDEASLRAAGAALSQVAG